MTYSIVVALLMALLPSAVEPDGPLVMFWNLENFFDWIDGGGGDSDREFSASGARHWTATRFYRKCESIAKAVLWTADSYGRVPDVIGVAEVENRGVLGRLVYNTALRKFGYSIIHRDSPDHRGIDVALMYRKDSFRVIRQGIRRLDSMATRDILFADMEYLPTGERTVFAVAHFPSKYGGPYTGGRREAASAALRSLCDSILSSGTGRFVAMGDFNDVPSSQAFSALTPVLHNLAAPYEESGRGTIRFGGRWEMIDMFWTSEELKDCRMDILRIPFLMVWDNTHPGMKPLRTYSGPRYLGGVSDHCPVIMRLP